jgi:hypothetical protein
MTKSRKKYKNKTIKTRKNNCLYTDEVIRIKKLIKEIKSQHKKNKKKI